MTIDELQIEIQAKGAESADGINALTTSLSALKKTINKSLLAKLSDLSSALDGIKAPITVNMNVKGMEQLKKSVQEATANIPANASNITPTVDGSAVASEMGKIKASTEQAAGGFTTITSEATKAKQELKSTGNAAGDTGKKLKEVGASAKRGASGLNKFASSLKRIALYRAIRFILKNITSAIKEGTQNLVRYSAAIGGIDASKASATMSQFASIGMQVKNTIGSALMPVLNALMPVIQTLANWFIIAANAVNQFFAAISGASMWTKAKEYAVDYADGLGKAAGAASDLKNAMLGIDELNVISPPGGGGGGGAGALDYENMFEEIPINQNLADLALKIKDIFFDWEDLTPNDIIDKIVVGLGVVTGAMIGWSVGGFSGAVIGAVIGAGLGLVITQLLPDFSNLSGRDIQTLIVGGIGAVIGGVAGFMLGGIPGAAVGIFVGTGIGLAIDKLLPDFSNLSKGEIQSLITSGIAGATGFAVGFGLGGFAGGLIGMVIGVGLSIIINEYRDDIKKWWEEKVAPWFTKERWQKLANDAGQGLKTKWNEFKNWWESTALVKWWRNDVKPWFTVAKWQGLGENMKQGLVNKWNEFKDWWSNTAIVKWWNESVAPWFTREKWIDLGEGLVEGFKQTWKNAVNAGIGLFNKFIDWINSKLNISWPSLNIMGKEIFAGGSFQLLTIPKIPTFEHGGYPVTGQMFLAREAGPEMVGTIGGRTAVANNDQIVQAVSEGVYEAVVAAMARAGGGENTSVNVYLDGKQINASVRKTQREKGAGILQSGVVFA